MAATSSTTMSLECLVPELILYKENILGQQAGFSTPALESIESQSINLQFEDDSGEFLLSLSEALSAEVCNEVINIVSQFINDIRLAPNRINIAFV